MISSFTSSPSLPFSSLLFLFPHAWSVRGTGSESTGDAEKATNLDVNSISET